MKRLLLFAAVIAIAVSCNNTPTARINAKVSGAADTTVVLQKLNFNRLAVIDTIKTDSEGAFSYKVKLTGSEPYFYYIYFGETPIASMVLLPSDEVNIEAATNGRFTIEGSKESSLLQQTNDAFAEAALKMKKVLDGTSEDEASIKNSNAELSRIYVDYKRAATRFVIENPFSIASAVTLFQKFNDGLPVFGDDTDGIIFQRTLDSLETVYPKAELLLAMRDAISVRRNALEMSDRFQNVETVSFPDLDMPDVNGQKQKLSSFEGKVIILSFWSVGQTEHKMFNNELLDLYGKYHDQGLEVYQVSLDIDKPSWAASVKNQNLPWVNVNDGLGTQSPSVVTYNIGHIPAMYVIGRNGDILGSDIYDSAALETIVKKAL